MMKKSIKKLLALVLSAVMLLAFGATVSAAPIVPETPDVADGDQTEFDVHFGDDLGGEVPITPGEGFVATDFNPNAFLLDGDDKLTVSAGGSVENSFGSIVVKTKTVTGTAEIEGKQVTQKGVLVTVKCSVPKSAVTVDEKTIEAKIKVVQAGKTLGRLEGVIPFKIVVRNKAYEAEDMWDDASGVIRLNDKEKVVISEDAFEEAAGKTVRLEYNDYTLKFSNVSRSQGALYIKADTGTVSGAVASIAFANGIVRSPLTITMPQSSNQYATGKVYVYQVDKDGKIIPSISPIEGEADGNYVEFSLPAGSVLGTYAAYKTEQVTQPETDETKGNTSSENVKIPETGAGNYLYFVFVIGFAVLALIGSGIYAVKRCAR